MTGVHGQMPLDPDEAEGLRLPVATRDGLNRVEAENIAEAVRWLSGLRPTPDTVLDEAFVRDLHRRMFGRVWRWAGTWRRTDTDIGVPWFEVPVHVRAVLDDTRAQVAGGIDPDEVAVRFGHRLVSVHPFANGNGRHSRLAADLLAAALGRPVFSWGEWGDLIAPGERRRRYLDALRTADGGDIIPLLRFARGESADVHDGGA